MADQDFVIIGAEESPYSVKVRSYFRYKNIPHRWTTRSESANVFEKHAKLPLIPLVVTPKDIGLQDSTPIIETLESQFPDPGIHPQDPLLRFLSILLEEFGDEWGNKWMFHLRWARDVDQIGCSQRIAAMVNPSASEEQLEAIAASIRKRMVDRVWFVGSNATTAPLIERSFQETLTLLDSHLATRRYLFGDRPAFADFGIWGQIYNANRDHTPASMIAKTRNVPGWIDRMQSPVSRGPFETWAALKDTLIPILQTQVSSMFLRWSEANSNAISKGDQEFSVDLDSGRWIQIPQKYHAKSLHALREKFQEFSDNQELRAILAHTGCLPYLEAT